MICTIRPPPFYATGRTDSTLMKELLRLYGQIALLRRGPQDLPASPTLLAVTVAGYFAINVVMYLVLRPFRGPWLMYLIVDILFGLAWYVVLLRAAGKAERFLQTATAMFGYQALLAPLIVSAGSFAKRFMGETQSSGMLLVAILALGLAVWVVAAGANIIKAALEWSMPASVATVIAQICVAELLMYALFQPSS
jgi:hypothetical protein